MSATARLAVIHDVVAGERFKPAHYCVRDVDSQGPCSFRNCRLFLLTAPLHCAGEVKGASQAEVGQLLGLSRERIRQIEKEAIAKIAYALDLPAPKARGKLATRLANVRKELGAEPKLGHKKTVKTPIDTVWVPPSLSQERNKVCDE